MIRHHLFCRNFVWHSYATEENLELDRYLTCFKAADTLVLRLVRLQAAFLKQVNLEVSNHSNTYLSIGNESGIFHRQNVLLYHSFEHPDSGNQQLQRIALSHSNSPFTNPIKSLTWKSIYKLNIT